MTSSRSYFSESVASAMALARQELGEDALLVSSRPALGADAARGRYEVVVAFPTPASATRVVTMPEAEAAETSGPSDWRNLLRDVAGLRHQISRLSRLVEHTSSLAPAMEEQTRLLECLLSADVPEETATRWLTRAETRMAAATEPLTLTAALREELELAVMANPEIRKTDQGPVVIAFVGPAGAGKTSTLVKMALRHGVAERRSTLLITTDTLRLGAVEQMRAYSAILGVPFAVAEKPEVISEIIEQNQQRQLILIDTPGLSPSELSAAGDLLSALEKIPQIEVHLVLTATTRSADLRCAMERWQTIKPTRLVLTHMDETSQHGHAIAAAAEQPLPISFLSWGRRIPEDLEPATQSRLLDLIWAETRIASGAAA